MRQSTQPILWKYPVYIIVFMIVAVITFLSIHYQSDSASTIEMTEAKLPIVSIEANDGTIYNPMHGIVQDIDTVSMDTPLTPLPSTNQLKIAIDTYGNVIEEISYKVRDTRDNSLIESTKVARFEESQSRVHATLGLKDLLSTGVEYMLEITVSTEITENIKFYTRIVSGQDTYASNCLNFALEFNSNTYSTSGQSEISSYIETTYGKDNSNYGSADIYCEASTITWGDLDPFIESNVVPTIESIESEVMTLFLDYTIGTVDTDGNYDTYAVHEYYRVRQGTMGMFLLAYKREANQIFDGKDDLYASGKIVLGIQSDLSVQAKDSSSHDFTCFENYGSLWSYSKSANTFIRIFSFDSDDSDNVRERYQRHKIKIMDVDDSGDVTFIVYGYMNRGAHEGMLGVSLYRYSYAGNSVEEYLFLPLDMPYEQIEENVGDIAYVNSENLFYIMINDSVYAVELNSKEIMTEIVGLTPDTYKVSEDGRIIAYSLNGELYNTDSIRIYNLEQGSEEIIEAPAGQVMRVLGFIESDCIYGYAYISDIAKDETGDTTFPMHTLDIMNDSYSVIKQYHEDGIYLSAVEVDSYRINMTRIVKDGSGGYTGTSVDQLINRSENSADEHVSVDSVYTASRKTEVVLVLPSGVGDVNASVAKAADNVQFSADRELTIEDIGEPKELYYVFCAGRLEGSCSDISSAVSAAAADYGYVRDYDSNLVWKKFKTSTASIKGLTASDAAFDGSCEDGMQVLRTFLGGSDTLRQVTLKGNTYDVALTLVSRGKPVLASTEAGYVIIVGYDTTQVTYLDGGKEVTVTSAAAAKLFSAGGNVFITFYE